MRQDANEDQEQHNDEAETREFLRKRKALKSASPASNPPSAKDGYFSAEDLPELQKRWPGITLEEANEIARTGGG